MEINFAEILRVLKELSGLRFYLVLGMFLVGFLIFLFRDELSSKIQSYSVNEVEFREVRNLKGLENSLNAIQIIHPIVNSYVVYIYQPKEKSFYKKMILTNSDIVKSITRLQGSYIDEQKYLNDALEDVSYVVISEDDYINEMQELHFMGIKHVLIKKFVDTQNTIGEVHLFLNSKPNKEEVDLLLKDLSPLNYMYIL